MSDFLTKILEHKRLEVLASSKLVPENVLRSRAEHSAARRSLYERLHAPGPSGINVVAEIKRASPSKGSIRQDVDAAKYAATYERGGAAAISVLTDKKYFSGNPLDLVEARKAASLPVLRKDFLIGTYQVFESAVLGADAVLLIARALAPQLLRDLICLCATVGLDALVEVHSEAELETAMFVGARLIGINNRDLDSFRTDIATSITLAGRAGAEHVIVSESGIHGREDIERLLDAGIFNFLIGESLMRSDDPARFLGILQGVKP